jgi:hypothetical protein
MPMTANRPAPVSAPKMRAVSMVVRAIPIAGVSRFGGIMSAIIAPRSPMSEGRTRPVTAASASTTPGCSAPTKASVITAPATIA